MAATQQQHQQQGPARSVPRLQTIKPSKQIKTPADWPLPDITPQMIQDKRLTPAQMKRVVEMLMVFDETPSPMNNKSGSLNIFIKPYAGAPNMDKPLRGRLGTWDEPLDVATFAKPKVDEATGKVLGTRRSLVLSTVTDDMRGIAAAYKVKALDACNRYVKKWFPGRTPLHAKAGQLSEDSLDALMPKHFHALASTEPDANGKMFKEAYFVKVELDNKNGNQTKLKDVIQDTSGQWVIHPNKDYLSAKKGEPIPQIPFEALEEKRVRVVIDYKLTVAYQVTQQFKPTILAETIYIINRGLQVAADEEGDDVVDLTGHEALAAFADAGDADCGGGGDAAGPPPPDPMVTGGSGGSGDSTLPPPPPEDDAPFHISGHKRSHAEMQSADGEGDGDGGDDDDSYYEGEQPPAAKVQRTA